jgi:UDP-N-acetylmuramate dehydrogenase
LKLFNNQNVTNFFKLPCVADSVYQLSNAEDYLELYQNITNPIVIGEGSNLILPPKLNKQVIKLNYKNISHNNNLIEISGGVTWEELIDYTLYHELYGLENLTAIPGLVTAAPVQNIGAYGVQISDFIESVICWDLESKNFTTLNKDDCCFNYRQSIFQSNKSLIIHKVILRLNKFFEPNISYQSIQDYFSLNQVDHNDLTPKKLSDIIRNIRLTRLPDPKINPNVGSFFKNPIINETQLSDIKNTYPNTPCWIENNLYKISAGWLISKIKTDLTYRDVEIFEPNNLVLINRGCSYNQLMRLISEIKTKVKDNFDIVLAVEPEIIA